MHLIPTRPVPSWLRAGGRRIEVPYSEVAMHMGIAGRHMWACPVGSGMVQLYEDDGRPFSFPITMSEAGFTTC